MSPLIDRARLTELVGQSPARLRRVAAAYLGQLPQWRADFARHLQARQTDEVARLLHKMKGSCHAIGATSVALEFEKAEHALQRASEVAAAPSSAPAAALAWNGAGLLALLEAVEAELQRMITEPGS